MLLHIHPVNPQERLIAQVVDCLRDGGIIIYPTDTVYAMGCDIRNKGAVERLCRLKGIKPEDSRFACICEDLKIVGEYALHVSTPVYKLMRRALPGPYTFILEASKNIPRFAQSRRKTIGIRVTDHPIPQMIVKLLGNPIITTSLVKDDTWEEYETYGEDIHERMGKLVDIVIEGGPGGQMASTVIDCSRGDDEIEVVREGLGSLDVL
jgi:tRNA threonylcarbamoyl adenosine modification protein (Sua5/YciO/YrdC/YwlC family)